MTFLRQLRNELWKMFGKRRTYIGSLMFLLAQSAIILLFRFSRGPYRHMLQQLERLGFDPAHYITALTIATSTLVATAYILLPLYVALVGGDLVAKEAEDGTLRMILARPITRLRLVLLKWLAGCLFSGLLVATVGLYGFGFARLFFPSGGLFVFFPMETVISTFEGAAAWQRYVAAHVALGLKGVAIMSLALMFSCFNIKPAAATILAISCVFISLILQQLPFFTDLRPWFFTYHLNLWSDFLEQPIAWWKIGQSFSILAGYTLTFLTIACTALQLRDIKS